MSLTPEQIRNLATDVSSWRIQEYISLPFLTLYLHYYFSTAEEEVARVHPQKRWAGKLIFYVLRYGTVLYVTLDLLSRYKTYVTISPTVCKIIMIASCFVTNLTAITADLTIGVCVSVLLRARKVYFLGIMCVCSLLPLVSLVFNVRGYALVPAESTSMLDKELGYPCSVPDSVLLMATLPGNSTQVFAYLNFARGSLLTVLAITTVLVKHKVDGGRLLGVIGRDGGTYYLAAAGAPTFNLTLSQSLILDHGNEKAHAFWEPLFPHQEYPSSAALYITQSWPS